MRNCSNSCRIDTSTGLEKTVNLKPKRVNENDDENMVHKASSRVQSPAPQIEIFGKRYTWSERTNIQQEQKQREGNFLWKVICTRHIYDLMTNLQIKAKKWKERIFVPFLSSTTIFVSKPKQFVWACERAFARRAHCDSSVCCFIK